MRVIGSHLAVALMTTFYGILLSNLLFKPVAVKLERRTEQRVALMNMVLQGISMMCAKRSPSLMRETLKSFVAQYDDEIFDAGNGNGNGKPNGTSAAAAARAAGLGASSRPVANRKA